MVFLDFFITKTRLFFLFWVLSWFFQRKIFSSTNTKYIYVMILKLCHRKQGFFNHSRSLLLTIPQAVWGGGTLTLPLRISTSTHRMNFHQELSFSPLTIVVDWWRHHFFHVTNVYFTDQTAFFLTSAEIEKWMCECFNLIQFPVPNI